MKTSLKRKREMLKQLQTAGQRWLSDDEYFEHYDEAVETAKNGESVNMMFELYGRAKDKDQDNQWAVMPVVFGDWPPPDNKKEEAMQGVGVLFAENFPDYMLVNVVHSSEAWMAKLDKDAPDEDKDLPPSQHPGKVEAVIVTACSLDRRMSQYVAEIIRNPDDSVEYEERINARHDPNNPHLPTDMQMHLSEHIYEGYNIARETRGIG